MSHLTKLLFPKRDAILHTLFISRPAHREITRPCMAQPVHAAHQQQLAQQALQQRQPPAKTYSRTPKYVCPACQNPAFALEKFQKHVDKCCPDLFSQPLEENTAAAELDAARQRQLDAQKAALRVAFHSYNAEGERTVLGAQEIANQLDVPLARAEKLLRVAMRSVPLAVTDELIQVIYEDEHLLAVNKPWGVPTAPRHRFEGGSMVNRVLAYLGREPYVCHRLDMHTSGVVLFTKTQDAVKDIHRQFRERCVTKRYVALASGSYSRSYTLVDAAIDRHPDDKVARRLDPEGQPATTDVWPLTVFSEADTSGFAPFSSTYAPAGLPQRGATLFCAAPRTGRTHQIRLHLAALNHPILGDELYGQQAPNLLPRMALHAAMLQLQHPVTKEVLHLVAPLPDDIRQAAEKLQMKLPAKLDEALASCKEPDAKAQQPILQT